MKIKFILATLFLIVGLAVTGCGPNRSDPEATARAAAKAFLDKDWEAFSRFVPANSSFDESDWDSGWFIQGTLGFDTRETKYISALWSDGPIAGYKITDVLVQGTIVPDVKGADVIFQFQGQRYKVGLGLERLSGEWYVRVGGIWIIEVTGAGS